MLILRSGVGKLTYIFDNVLQFYYNRNIRNENTEGMKMSKATTVQARIELDLKKQGDAILKKVGVSASQVINALYAQIVLRKGVPFELKIPNKATHEAITELEKGGGKQFSSFQNMVDDLKNDDV